MTTFGMYVNEVVKRADPKGRPLWVIFDEDIAKKFGNKFLLHWYCKRFEMHH